MNNTNYAIVAAITFALVSTVILLDCSESSAQDAKHCIKLRNGKEYEWSKESTPYLTNTCDRDVEVVWCHETGKDEVSRCGYKGKYLQSNHVLKPGEKRFNSYTVPEGSAIRHGACFGGYYSTKVEGESYSCKTRG